VASPTRIIHIDRFPVDRAGLHALLSPEPDFAIVGQADSLESGLELARREKADVVIADPDVPDEEECFAAIHVIRREIPTAKLLLFTRRDTEQFFARAVSFGVDGFICKRTPVETISEAVRRVAAGERFLLPPLTYPSDAPPWRNADSEAIKLLSERELEVGRLLALGLSVKEIAVSLHRSVKTVDAHKTHLMAKLNLHDRVSVARWAIRAGIVRL